MQNIKTFIFNRFNILFPLFCLSVLSIFLLSIRLKITHSFFYLFLVWNLFLAMIPFIVAMYLKSAEKLRKVKLYFLLILWLLFLPNAPYLLTDFIHLRLSAKEWIVYDSLMISFFAIAGLAFYASSISAVFKILRDHFSKKIVSIFMAILPFMVSFGMYLGRVLRWNSWDILHNPLHLFTDVLYIIIAPVENLYAWLFIVLIGFLLKLVYWAFDRFINAE